MKDIMLDIETMGKGNNASIMSIGACYFNPDTGETGSTFHEQINIETNGVIDASTVIWWMAQDDEARGKFKNNGNANHINVVLLALSNWIKKDSDVWGNGISFDNVIIKSAYKKADFPAPWNFWADCDVRTIVKIGIAKGINPKKTLKFEGIKHDALADAIHQAKYVSLIWQSLTN